MVMLPSVPTRQVVSPPSCDEPTARKAVPPTRKPSMSDTPFGVVFGVSSRCVTRPRKAQGQPGWW